MQCMACVEICPVGIEHVPMINQMRRQLVERGEMDSQLQGTLETIYPSGNSFGEAKRKRARWARELDFDVKDIRKQPAEHLWFVGDYASFDPRNQKVTQALARVLHDCGVDFGILGDAEKTAGNEVPPPGHHPPAPPAPGAWPPPPPATRRRRQEPTPAGPARRACGRRSRRKTSRPSRPAA